MSQTFLNAAINLRQESMKLVKKNGWKADPGEVLEAFDDDIGCNVAKNYGNPDKALMYGVATVRDLSGNNHFMANANNWRQGKTVYHVEDWLRDMICDHYKQSNTGMTCAKVAFFMPASPCRLCTANIVKWAGDMARYISGAEASRKVFFVFNFKEYYVANGQSNGNTAGFWTSGKGKSAQANAQEAYAAITEKSGRTDFLPNKQGGQFTLPIINFRQAASGSDQVAKFDRLAGKQRLIGPQG